MSNLEKLINALTLTIVTYYGKKKGETETAIEEKYKQISAQKSDTKMDSLGGLIAEISHDETGKKYLRAPLYTYILNVLHSLQTLVNSQFPFDEELKKSVKEDVVNFMKNMELLVNTPQNTQIKVKYTIFHDAEGNIEKEDNLHGLQNGIVRYSLCVSGTIITNLLESFDVALRNNIDLIIDLYILNKEVEGLQDRNAALKQENFTLKDLVSDLREDNAILAEQNNTFLSIKNSPVKQKVFDLPNLDMSPAPKPNLKTQKQAKSPLFKFGSGNGFLSFFQQLLEEGPESPGCVQASPKKSN